MNSVLVIYQDGYGNSVGRVIMHDDDVKYLLWKEVAPNVKGALIFTSEDEFASSQRVHRFVEYIPEQYK